MSRDAGFATVVFDCDSTLVRLEGIDWLAAEHGAEVHALTKAAMQGRLPLEEVYGRRLAIIRPDRARVEALGRAYVQSLVPDARSTVAALRWLGKEVRIVSGGLRPPVEHLARELGLDTAKAAAVGIHWTADGQYGGWDEQSPLARSGGKPRVIAAWPLPRPVLLVGDGATDLEARPAVDAFAAYMGVEHHPAVAAGADVVLTAPSLAPVLALAADDADRARLRSSRWADLLQKGERLLAEPPTLSGP